MKNLLKFLLFVLLISAAISALHDYRLKHGGRNFLAQTTAGKYSVSTNVSVDPKEVMGLENLNKERRGLVAAVLPAVVSIRTSKKVVSPRRSFGLDPSEFYNRKPRQFRSPNEEEMVQNSLGSGVIVSVEGHIITNNHVIEQVDQIEVLLSDGRTKKAELVGADATVDLAVLKIDEPGLKSLKFGDSDAVQAGDSVLAIGNPFGFEETVTDGIISSKGRPNRADGFGDYLQTNAAINPGNSGGPLVNVRGEIIGINTAIISKSGGSQGIGFAIPSNSVRAALESLLKNGRIIRGYLGILSRNIGPGITETEGVLVDEIVPGSPADEAQMKKGDVIRKFNGHDVKAFNELKTFVAQVELNKKVEIEVMRNGRPLKLTTSIKEQPVDYKTTRIDPRESPSAPRRQPPPEPEDEPDDAGAFASIEVGELTPEMARRLDLPNSVTGVIVTRVGSDENQLRTGDVIEEVNQRSVTSVADYKRVVSSLDPNETHVLSVCRHRTRTSVVLRPR
jgi:serine protease Do